MSDSDKIKIKQTGALPPKIKNLDKPQRMQC